MEVLYSVLSWGTPVGIGVFFCLWGIGAGVFLWGLSCLKNS